MSIERAQTLIRQAQATLDEALHELEAAPVPPASVIETPEQFDAALDAAEPGAVLVLAPTFVYPDPITIPETDLTIQSATLHEGRMTREDLCPLFMYGLTITGERVTLAGLELRNIGAWTDILILQQCVSPRIDRCRILGDPVNGAKRGIAANGINAVITGCYIDDCFGPYPGQDTQAILIWDTPGPVTITDNYLCGGSETIMVGGADPSSEAHLPSDITIIGNTITKNPAWQTQAVNVKNVVELKNARRVTIRDNDISRSWGGKGQDGYLVMLTPRNQDGHAPYSTVEDVEISFNRFAHGAAAMNLLGTDNLQPSGRLCRIAIRDNVFEDLNPQTYAGSNRMILVLDGPEHVVIDRNQFVGEAIGSHLYFSGSPLCEALEVTNNCFPASKYGCFGNNASTGTADDGNPKAWNQYVASGTYADNVITDAD